MKCAVITPVGPGHEAVAQECRRSVEIARSHPGAFTAIEHLLVDDTAAQLGRSRARNQAVEHASTLGCEWIFFLDADDLMAAGAFVAAQPHLGNHDAIWGAIVEYSEADGSAVPRIPQIITMSSLQELLLHDPFRTLQMGHFVRTDVARRHPFDEALNTGEDFDYYLRVWAQYRCVKLPAILFANRRGRHSTGPRSATGRDWSVAVSERVALALQRVGLDPASEEARRVVNAKSVEYSLFARKHGLVNARNRDLFARVMPYHGAWKVDCYPCSPFWLRTENDDPTVTCLIWQGSFEAGPIGLWLRLVQQAGAVVDLGRDSGIYALSAVAADPGRAVFCIRPVGAAFDRVAANLVLNGATSVTLLAGGGTDMGQRADAGGPCLIVPEELRTPSTGRIAAIRLADLSDMAAVLERLAPVLERDHPDLLVTSPDSADRALDERLPGWGYRCYTVDEHECRVSTATSGGDGGGRRFTLLSVRAPEVLASRMRIGIPVA